MLPKWDHPLPPQENTEWRGSHAPGERDESSALVPPIRIKQAMGWVKCDRIVKNNLRCGLLGLQRQHLWYPRSFVGSAAEPEFVHFPREAFELLHTGLSVAAQLAIVEDHSVHDTPSRPEMPTDHGQKSQEPYLAPTMSGGPRHRDLMGVTQSQDHHRNQQEQGQQDSGDASDCVVGSCTLAF